MNNPVSETNACNMVYTTRTGGNPDANKLWVGDFPPDPYPYQPTIDPLPWIPQPVAPPGIIPGSTWYPQNCSWGTITIGGSTNPWHLEFKADRIIATIDVPGCKAEGIELSLTNGTLSVKATRTKGGYSSFDTQIGTDYDPETAEADVEDGVLTVTVMRFKEKISKKIAVKAK